MGSQFLHRTIELLKFNEDFSKTNATVKVIEVEEKNPPKICRNRFKTKYMSSILLQSQRSPRIILAKVSTLKKICQENYRRFQIKGGKSNQAGEKRRGKPSVKGGKIQRGAKNNYQWVILYDTINIINQHNTTYHQSNNFSIQQSNLYLITTIYDGISTYFNSKKLSKLKLIQNRKNGKRKRKQKQTWERKSFENSDIWFNLFCSRRGELR